MNTFLSIIIVFFLTIFCGTDAQWYINKKDYPSISMNYPNPGKRSISEPEFDVDCSIPYAALTSYEEKTAWLLSCKDQRSPLIANKDSSSSFSSSSSSSSNSVEDEFYSSPQLILRERRTSRSIPPYFHEQRDLFNLRLLQRLRQSIKK